MWKKLSDLLFEDDEIIDEELEEEIIEKPVKKQVLKSEPVKEVKPQVKVDSIKVDNTTSLKTSEQHKPIIEEKPKPIGIKIEEIQEVKPQVQQVKPQPVVQERIKTIPNKKVENKYNYEFTPVISPIFGVSEKDMDVTLPTITKKKTTITDSKIGTVISPMYGIDRDSQPDTIVSNVTPKINSMEELEAEKEVVNFSLDEILAKRDLQDNKKYEQKNSDEQEIDKTVVLTNHNISLFDDEEN